MNVSVCLRIIASLSLGSGSLCMMCSMKSLGMTDAMFHLSFPSTTSSQSCKRQQKKNLTIYFAFVLKVATVSGGHSWQRGGAALPALYQITSPNLIAPRTRTMKAILFYIVLQSYSEHPPHSAQGNAKRTISSIGVLL